MHTLMIVDDSNIIRRKIERSHDTGRFKLVGTASNGKDAVTLFEKEKPEIITMDLTMPEMDGIECIARLNEIDPDVRILVVSALSDKATGIEALQNGARGFLCKPFTDEELTSALNEVLEP